LLVLDITGLQNSPHDYYDYYTTTITTTTMYSTNDHEFDGQPRVSWY